MSTTIFERFSAIRLFNSSSSAICFSNSVFKELNLSTKLKSSSSSASSSPTQSTAKPTTSGATNRQTFDSRSSPRPALRRVNSDELNSHSRRNPVTSSESKRTTVHQPLDSRTLSGHNDLVLLSATASLSQKGSFS